MRRERHNLSMLTFPSAPNHVQPRPQTTGLASASSESQPSSSDAKTQLTDFSQLSKILCVITSFTPPGHISYLGFYFDVWEWRIHPARAWAPALMLHLTNSCTKRKVLSLTKPKGKIYKTKSLGHYITLMMLQLNRNAIVSTLHLNKSHLLLGLPWINFSLYIVLPSRLGL